jgi:hypothetical protein
MRFYCLTVKDNQVVDVYEMQKRGRKIESNQTEMQYYFI